MITFHDVAQYSDEWYDLRAGHITGSGIKNIYSERDTASYRNYLYKIALERITGRAIRGNNFSNVHTRRGHELEPVARSLYEVEKNLISCDAIGFATNSEIPYFGVSPDGKKLEIKCPVEAIHHEYIRLGKVPEIYVKQCDALMLCCDWDYVDFVSYNENFPEQMQLHIVRHNRNEIAMRGMEKNIQIFNQDVDILIAELSKGLIKHTPPAEAFL